MTNQSDIADNLPDLESRVFAAVRSGGPASVNEIIVRLTAEQRPLAYTTVMTVLSRLWRKGYLTRQPEGRAYVYEARPAEEIAGEIGGRVVSEAIAKFGVPALNNFVKALSPEQRVLVARLLSEDADYAGARQ